MFDAIVWDQLLAYAPYPWGLALNSAIRTQLWTAILIRSGGPLPKPRRVVTLTPEQAEELEVWLAAIVRPARCARRYPRRAGRASRGATTRSVARSPLSDESCW